MQATAWTASAAGVVLLLSGCQRRHAGRAGGRRDPKRLERLAVTGYTDAVGDDASNRALSERRAAAVRDALAPQLPGVDLTLIGRGEADPVAPNTRPDGSDDLAGRAANRRVTLTTTR